jgi:hypothetical protein
LKLKDIINAASNGVALPLKNQLPFMYHYDILLRIHAGLTLKNEPSKEKATVISLKDRKI